MENPRDFPQAYARFLAPVRAKCRRMLGAGAAADDVVQEAFTRLWESGPRLPPADTRTIMAWLYVTSTRLAVDALRARREVPMATDRLEPLPCAASPAAALAARSSIAALCKVVPNEELEVALLTRVDGLPQDQVALLLGVSERTVRRLLERFDVHSAHLRQEVMP
jgi:RNA polymerase sigma-70 factor (ECF subfamily)